MWTVAFATLAFVAAIPLGPTAVLTVDDAYPAIGQPVHFNASASTSHDSGNGRIVSFAFSFGDGFGSGLQSSPFADHSYGTAGVFVATVTVTDGRGQESMASVTVHPGTAPPPGGETPDLVPIQAQLIPANPIANDSVNVTVVLLNRGAVAATGAAISAIDTPENGTPTRVASATLSTPVAASQTVSLAMGPFVAVAPGNHTLRIVVANVTPAEANPGDREFDLSFMVSSAGPPSNPSGPAFALSPLAVGLGGAAVAAGIGAALLLLRPRPPGPLEPPPANPPDRSPPPIWPP